MKLSRETALKIILVGLLLGIFTDISARQNILGLNFVLFVLVWVILCGLATIGKGRDLRQPFIYGTLALLNALFVYWRASPLIQFWSVCISLASLGLLALTAFVENYRELPLFARFPAGFSRFVRMSKTTPKELTTGLRQGESVTVKVSRGVIGAVALGFIFILLFASADQVFGRSFSWLGDALRSFSEFFRQYDVIRFTLIAFWTALSIVVLLLLLQRLPVKKPVQKTITQSLTLRDAHLMVWTLVAIFTVFVTLQLRYLFAGGTLPDGLTYATYAHRGYGQLLVATLLASAVIKYVVSALRVDPAKHTKVAATVLIVLNSVVILSAWKRLSLYEATYGWTLLRFTARLGLVCILLGSVSLVAWLWSKLTSRQLYATGWYILVGILMTAAVLNPEGIIARKNITERPGRTVGLDAMYVASLSADSRPAICEAAPALRAKYPAEYAKLRDYLKIYPPVHNHGFARHATGTETFTARHKTCLR